MKVGQTIAIAAGATWLALWGGGCSSNSGGGLTAGPALDLGSPGASSGASSGTGGGGSGPASSGAGAPALPPETKTEGNFQTPIATSKYVWIANPTSNRVAFIDVQTYAVQTVVAGEGPTYLAAVPDPTDDVALVQNVRSQDATLLRDHQGSNQVGTITSETFQSTSDANSWTVSRSGRWAIAWTDVTHISGPMPDPTQGFQDIAVLDLSAHSAAPSTILAVGYRPSQMAFSGDDKHAYAVTEDGITVIDLVGGAQPTATGNYPLVQQAPSLPAQTPEPAPEAGSQSADSGATPDASMIADGGPGSDGGTLQEAAATADTGIVKAVGTSLAQSGTMPPDVSFTPDAAYAVVRSGNVPSVSLLSLADGTSTQVNLDAVPTDLTISPDGTFAVAVLRDISAVAVMRLPDIAHDPSALTTISLGSETIGRAIVTKGGKTVLLFTTVALSETHLTVLALQPAPAAPTFRTITLRAPVQAVFATDDAQNAVVLHDVPMGGPVKGAFSLVPIAPTVALPPKIISLPAPPTAVALAPTSDRALVSLRDDGTSTFGAYLAKMPSLEVLSYTLASPPTAVGMVSGIPGGATGALPDSGASTVARGYIAQDFADGRITFVTLSDGAQRTITGFELGARVVQGSQP